MLGLPEFLAWIDRLGAWPPDAVTANPEDLGLTAEDLANAGSAAERAQQEKERERNSVKIGDTNYGMDAATKLVAAVRATLQDDPLLSCATAPSTLGNVPVPEGGGGGGSGGGKGKVKRREVSDEKKRAIGLVGETLAYAWLKKHYTHATPESWVSGYRQLGVGGDEGNDFLGYDFVVSHRGRLVKFEVKATTGSTYEFELGPSEIAAAKAAKPGTYQILFIHNVLEPGVRRLLVLPNPYEPAHRSKFRDMNEGVHFRFAPGA